MRIMIEVNDCDMRDGEFHPADSGYQPMTCRSCENFFRVVDPSFCMAGFGDQIDNPDDHFCAAWEARQ